MNFSYAPFVPHAPTTLTFHISSSLGATFFMSFGLLFSYLPCCLIHSQLTPILNLLVSQIPSDIILSSLPPSNSSYCSQSPIFHFFFQPSFLYPSFNMSNPSISLCFYVSIYTCILLYFIALILFRKTTHRKYNKNTENVRIT